MTSDKDLQFLQFSNNDDLLTLCNILVLDDNGDYRLNEQLTSKESYIECYPDNMKHMWQDIAAELQRYGGNTILNIIMRKGRGPAYEEIVEDACHKLKIKVSEHASCREMEQLMVDEIISRVLGEMSEENLRALCDALNIGKSKQFPKLAIMSALSLSRKLGMKVYLYLLRIIIQFIERFLIGRGVLIATGAIVSRSLGIIFGPIGLAALTGWTIWDIAGPAYRVTIPAIIQVALMRMSYMSEQKKENVA